MSKICRADAQAMIDNYNERIRSRLPMTAHRDTAITHIRDVLGRSKGPLELEELNYVRLVKHYLPELNSKLGPGTIHDLFTIAVSLLPTLAIGFDVQKAVKRARVLYDQQDRRVGLAVRASLS